LKVMEVRDMPGESVGGLLAAALAHHALISAMEAPEAVRIPEDSLDDARIQGLDQPRVSERAGDVSLVVWLPPRANEPVSASESAGEENLFVSASARSGVLDGSDGEDLLSPNSAGSSAGDSGGAGA